MDNYYKKETSLFELYRLYENNQSIVIGKIIKIYGWIRRVRSGVNDTIAFIDIYDGTCVGTLKCLAIKDEYLGSMYDDTYTKADDLTDADKFETLSFDQLLKAETLSDGCSVVIEGKLVLSPKDASQKIELQIKRLRVIGGVFDPTTYPIQKTSEKQLQTLRKYPFMRMRAEAMQCIFRISSVLELGIHTFMSEQRVCKLDPNILTMSDSEGAGETFSVAPVMFSKDPEGKDIPVGLTVSSQLPLEAGITGFKKVYTAQKSFRAEKSDTLKHLAEFFHIEFEAAFITLSDLMQFTESFVKYIIKYTLERCNDEFKFLESKLAPADLKPSRRLLSELLERPFIKIKHSDAVDLIHKLVKDKYMLPDENGQMKRIKLEKLPQKGQDFNSEHEKLLVKYFGWMSNTIEEQNEKMEEGYEFGAFVFLTHWPLNIKSFYMKQCDDDTGECESFDLLAPRVGELIGGSVRQAVYEKLMSEILKRGMDTKPIQWYIDLRKSGSVPHGGFGMGFSRLAMLITGAPSVRDVVFLPVYYGHCPY